MNKSGFTIIELIVAFGLLLCLISAITIMTGQSKHSANASQERLKAVLLLHSKAEELSSQSFGYLAGQSTISFEQNKGLVKITKLNADLLKLSITYKYQTNKPALFLQTLRSLY